MMKMLIKLIEECLKSPHKIRGRICLICFLVLIIGVLFTLNNFINNPIKTEFHLEKSK